MRTCNFIWFLFVFYSCKKSTNSASVRLLRMEATSYNGDVFHTEYGYDNQGRITTITTYTNSETPTVAVTVTYGNGNVSLLSHPETDPTYDQAKEVHLIIDDGGRMLKRVEYTHAVAKAPAVQPTEKFSYDTVNCEYDASGFLSKTTESRDDSTWVEPDFYTVSRLTSTVSYTMEAGNLIKTDQYAVYPVITSRAGIITLSGGNSEYHNQFKCSKSFPNRTDFKNAAVLNEYATYYEPLLNRSYQNMPDQVIRSSTDKDINGSVLFTGTSTIDIERTYNTDGLLSTESVLSQNTPYTVIYYFYGR